MAPDWCGGDGVQGDFLAHAPTVLCISADAALTDDVQRLTSATGVSVQVTLDALAAVPWWSTADLVLVDVANLAQVRMLSLPRRPAVVALTRNAGTGQTWREALAAGVQTVVTLPAGEGWLLEAVARAGQRDSIRAPVVVVVGARGGAGASVLTAALARTSVAQDLHCYAIDLDPGGCGLHTTMGADRLQGVGWHDLVSATGRIPLDVLRRELPVLDGVRVLAWTQPGTPMPLPGVAASLLDAASRDADLVVVDLARWLLINASTDVSLALEVVARTDVMLVVCPADVRSAAAAQRLLASPALRSVSQVGLVVRGPAPGALTGEDISEALGVRLVVAMAAQPGIERVMEDGLPPGRSRRGPLLRGCLKILDDVVQSVGLR